MISYNKVPFLGNEEIYIKEVLKQGKLCGDGRYTKMCSQWLEDNLRINRAFLTTSCTHATEIAAMLCGIEPGDEVILPSFTFVSTANAFILRGAKAVFVDIRPDTMNIDENLIEAAVTKKTKAVVPVHYAGVACEMDTILDIANRHGLFVVEDAAQAILSTYKDRFLGTIADFGCLSFHETKNVTMGEGGALLVKNKRFAGQAEVIREKGTDRSSFFRGEIDKYTWKAAGSSYLPSELNAAYLYAQLERAQEIINDRRRSWRIYEKALKALEEKGRITLPHIPKECRHNGHIFYIKARDLDERTKLLKFLKDKEIGAVFHYVPLHSSSAGKKFGRFYGEDRYTTKESERLVRLPLYYGMRNEIYKVIEAVYEYYK